MKDGLKSVAMECGGPLMEDGHGYGMLMMLLLFVDSLDISNTQVSFKSVVHPHDPHRLS